ncbi:peptidoglycan DD-metalloendopeptidase family protein [Parvibaculum sedimenti]|uniref:Peptidoglycan DD-metalloendopeptidase family protein n=1 Tax=Parvibaculum sedimenti TaxID=2608632 RepID=A0A6N6VIJ0_9HYPH|nr:peptidoglycan DD-metalloendopeptidase family protein [Parvibaculum sedimenti]KAB7738681.1 peptidoglycan DD-metalloendopeptidase family protein [Parvibaculum sedimenti]
MYDTGKNSDEFGMDKGGSEADAGGETFAPVARFRRSLQRSMKLYLSVSRLVLGQSLGQHRWLAATGLAGALSFALLGAGVSALVAPYSDVETAALTADQAPQIVALDADGPVERVTLGAEAPTEEAPAQTASNEPTAAETAGIATSSAHTELAAPVAPAEPKEIQTKVAINDGETLMQVLTDAGADRVDAYHAIAAMKPHFSPSKMRAGQEVSLTFLTNPTAEKDEPAKLLTSISLQPDIERAIQVNRAEDGSYRTQEFQKELKSGFAHAKGAINSSLFLDAQQAGIPAPIILEMIRMFSYSVDFQREIHPGDTFEVFFDRKYDEDGIPVKEGQIAYASLTVDGKPYRLWRFKTADGDWDYYDENGNSMKKFLMKTPVDGARISSGFGMRKHPILGFTKFHEGVDFAAPKGTPIYAAGDGVVKIAGWVNGYGNFVELSHANRYETAYGHMSAFAKGIHPGIRVHQGQVIGYVGSTGRSTGPHLHYEIHIAGKKVNPLGVKMATGEKLGGKQLAAFKATRANVGSQMAETPLMTRVAQASETPKAN